MDPLHGLVIDTVSYPLISSEIFLIMAHIFCHMDHTVQNSTTSYVMLTNKMHFLNSCFNSVRLVVCMFRTSYVYHQEDYRAHPPTC